MHIPKRGIGEWAFERINMCSASLTERIQRGAVYRSLFLTGSEDGDPQTYNKSFSYIEKLSSNLFSPVDLTFAIRAPTGSGPDERAKCKMASSELNARLRNAEVDEWLSEGFDWSLIKGKIHLKLLWDPFEEEFDCYVLQPEFFGVGREDISRLDRQEMFFHSTYMTLDEFERRVQNHEDAKQLIAKAKRYVKSASKTEGPDRDLVLKQIILGGTNPFQITGGAPPSGARGVVNWLSGPSPVFSARSLQDIIRLDELWVWDTPRKDWTTIQIVGPDCVVEGRGIQRNIFSRDSTTDPDMPDEENPLRGMHPFLEICPNTLTNYYWGRSELVNIALAQKTLNARVDGINKLLRKQEDPPRVFKGSNSINEVAYARLNRPGGWLADGPTMSQESLAPEIPTGLYESMHESVGIFEDMADNPPVMQGRGESGVRSQGHADTLVRTASPRLKRRAIRCERQVANVGALGLAILKAKDPTKYTAYVPAGEAGIQAALPPSDPLAQAPAPHMKSIDFTLSQVDKGARVHVDSHSSSPIFAAEARSLIFDLVKIGSVTPEQAIELLHAPDEDELTAAAERRASDKAEQQAQLARENPDQALKILQGGKKK